IEYAERPHDWRHAREALKTERCQVDLLNRFRDFGCDLRQQLRKSAYTRGLRHLGFLFADNQAEVVFKGPVDRIGNGQRNRARRRPLGNASEQVRVRVPDGHLLCERGTAEECERENTGARGFHWAAIPFHIRSKMKSTSWLIFD